MQERARVDDIRIACLRRRAGGVRPGFLLGRACAGAGAAERGGRPCRDPSDEADRALRLRPAGPGAVGPAAANATGRREPGGHAGVRRPGGRHHGRPRPERRFFRVDLQLRGPANDDELRAAVRAERCAEICAERCAARHADPTPDVCAEVGRLAHRRIRRAPDAGLRPAGPSDARRRASCGLAADAGDRVSGGLATSAGECAWRTFCRTGIAPSGRIGGRRTTSGAWRAAGGRRDAPVPCGVTRDPGHGAGGGRCAQNSRGRRRRADKRGVSRAAGMGGCDGAGRDACGRGGACGLDNGCPHRDACDRRRPIAVERRFGVGFGVGVEFSNSPRC